MSLFVLSGLPELRAYPGS